MLEAAAARQISTAVVIVDHGKRYTSRSKAEVGREILKWLYERISMHLSDRNDIGIVIADKPGGGAKQDSRWLADTLKLTNDGTEYVTPDRIVMPIVTAASHHVPHLQLADLVVAATTAAVAGHPHGLALGPLLLQLAHKNKWDLAGGAGIVLWAKSATCQPPVLGFRREDLREGRHEQWLDTAVARLALCDRQRP
jgi:hypothetical protein